MAQKHQLFADGGSHGIRLGILSGAVGHMGVDHSGHSVDSQIAVTSGNEVAKRLL